MLVAWLVFPLLLGALAYGCGLLVQRIAGVDLPGALIPPLGLAAILVVAQLATTFDATAELAAPLVVGLAIAGVLVSRGRRTPKPSRWELGAAVGVFAVFAAPIVASGDATIAGYTKLEDGSTFLAFAEHALSAGRSSDYPAASYLAFYNGIDYPVASLLPFGIGGQLLGEEIAWLLQPYLALLAGMLALTLQALCAPVVKSPWRRALVAFVAAQAALLFGFAMWGGLKELAAAFLLPLAAALLWGAARAPAGWRPLLPPAVVVAATVSALSFGAIAWLGVPLVMTFAVLARSHGLPAVVKRSATFAAVCALLVVAAVPTTGFVSSPGTRSALTSQAELGTLPGPLHPLQATGVWLGGDFRLAPDHQLLTLLLIVVVLCGAAAGAWVSRQEGGRAALFYAAGATVGGVAIVSQGAPWVDAKALATVSPRPVLLAMTAGAHATENGSRVAGWCMIALVGAGVLASNALAYGGVTLAPRDRLEELALIGERFAGAGPALLTREEVYANRYFLRHVGVENAAEKRWHRQIRLRSGRVIPTWRSVDTDELHPASVAPYRLLVLRRSPVSSRPPSSFRLAWRGRWYEVWKRTGPSALGRLALGGGLDAAEVPSCTAVRRFARRYRGSELAVAPPPEAVVASLARDALPAGWRTDKRFPGAAVPSRSGSVAATVDLPHGGRWQVWIGGGVPGEVTLAADGRRLRTMNHRLNRVGDYEPAATTELAAGRHRLTVHYEERLVSGRSDNQTLGPLALTPVGPPAKPVYLAARDADSLCGRRLDWVEAVRR